MRFARSVGFWAVVMGAGAGPALADYGVRPTWTDFQPAIATQYRPADGGRIYRPPNTATLQRDRPPRDLPPPKIEQRPGAPRTPGLDPTTNPANKPPSQVGR